MPRTEGITIDLDSLTPGEWATVRAVGEQGGITPELWPLVDFTNPPPQVMAGLLFVTLRRSGKRVTAGRCVRLALAHEEVARGNG